METKKVACVECGKVAQVVGPAKSWACPSCELIQKVEPGRDPVRVCDGARFGDPCATCDALDCRLAICDPLFFPEVDESPVLAPPDVEVEERARLAAEPQVDGEEVEEEDPASTPYTAEEWADLENQIAADDEAIAFGEGGL